jgi:type I restriction enzyme M protein
VDAYKSFSEEKGFSRIVPLTEMNQNDSNLNVTLYVMQNEESEGINIAQEYAELKELEKQRIDVANKLEQYISKLTQALGD